MPPAPHTAFISYSRADSEFALRLARDLKGAGARVWLDQIDISPGQSWDNAIETALTASEYMLLILSPASAKSENVRDEVSYALENGKTVIPVLYMDCVIPLRLQRKQRIDFRADYARGLSGLLDQLRVENPDQAVVQKAAEDEAIRQTAWRAREAESKRLAELKERERQEEAARAAEAARQQQSADQAEKEEADRQRLASQRAAKEEAERKARQQAAAAVAQVKPVQPVSTAQPVSGPQPSPAVRPVQPAVAPMVAPISGVMPGAIPIVVAEPSAQGKSGGWLGILAVVGVLAAIGYYYSKPPTPVAPPVTTAQLAQMQSFTGHWDADNGYILVSNTKWTNNSKVAIASATLECDQYGASNNDLAQMRTTLDGPVQPGGSDTFDPFQMGAVAAYLNHVNCQIVDVAPVKTSSN